MDPASNPNVAFVSSDKKLKGPWPVCHTCGKQHKGGWELCGQITKKVRANIGKLVAAGTFDDKSSRSSSSSGDNTTASRTSSSGKPTKQKKGDNKLLQS